MTGLPNVRVAPLVVGVVALVAGAAAFRFGGDPRQGITAAVAALTIGLWATGALAEHVTGFTFFVLASLLALAPPEVIFSGFASNALWLVIGGLIIGVAVERTGVAAWIASLLVLRVGSTYPRIVTSVVVGAAALGFLVPSAMARGLILIPIIARLADQLGVVPRGKTGLLVAAALGTFLVPMAILPANLPNAVLVGSADTLYGLRLGYGSYLLTHFPVLGACKALLIVLVVRWLFHSPIDPRAAGSPDAAGSVNTTLSGDGRRCLGLLTVALVLWVSDGWHGIAPGWISAAIGLVCLLPGINLVPPERFQRDVSLATVIYIAAVLGVGALVADSGVGDLVATGVLDALSLDPARPGWSFTVLVGLATLLGTFATLPGTVVILAPLAEQTAALSGLPVTTVLMTIVVGYATVAMPYQAAPLVFALKLANVSFADGARSTLLVFAGTILILLPLDYLWWRAIGLL